MRTRITTAIAAMAFIGLIFAPPAHAKIYRFMAGQTGGTFFTVGGALKGIIEKHLKGVTIEVTHGGGLANLRGIQQGVTTLAFANSVTTVNAVAGKPPFNHPNAPHKICNVASLFPQYFQVVTLASDKNINSVKDFKGKAVAGQVKGNTGEVLLEAVLKANGLKDGDLSNLYQVNFNDAVNLMKDGHANIFTLANTIPSGAVLNLASARTIKLVPIDKKTFEALKKTQPGLLYGAIPAGTYPKVDTAVPALTWEAHIVAACDAPDALVTAVAKAVADNVKSLTSVAHSIAGLTIQKMATNIGVPFHPAAKKFYAEHGITVK